ncbi:hypothetical protein D3C71_2066200 [compost metagenome]
MIQLVVILGQENLNAEMLLQLNQIVHQPHQHDFKIKRAFVLADQLGEERIECFCYLLLIPKADTVEQL